MGIFARFCGLTIPHLMAEAGRSVGVGGDGAQALAQFITERFTDQSQRLTMALRASSERGWKSLEIALAGDTLWDRCKALLVKGEDRALAQQVRAFLDAAPLPDEANDPAFRQQCLEELRRARKAGALTGESVSATELADEAVSFARFTDPDALQQAQWRAVGGLTEELQRAGYQNLAKLLARKADGLPLPVLAARYFFRRATEEDEQLFRGLSVSRLESLGQAQERGFASLSEALSQQGDRLEGVLGDVRALVAKTHDAVLDLQGQIAGQSAQIRDLGAAVMKLLDQHHLQKRELRPGDSLSLRDDGERDVVRKLVARYRTLPEQKRREVPALLDAVGKLQVVVGDFGSAQKDFQQLAEMVDDGPARAEAHFNAYRAALEKREWGAALAELLKAVKLDARRFAPFPVGKYQPQRILGAGGFGVAFLCKHKYSAADVVVKTLTLDGSSRSAEKVFTEAKLLNQVQHPGIIRLTDCGYVDAEKKDRPFLVMDYFPGETLQEYVEKRGPLSPEDVQTIGKALADGLTAAHAKGIFHRDVKPANVLVRKSRDGWDVRIIDFGLALKQPGVNAAETMRREKTLMGGSIAGTLDYGAPEQLGKLPGVAVGPASDVYGWAKTCCYALFQTPAPLPKHFRNLPENLSGLLEWCLEEPPGDRPQNFDEVLEKLDAPVELDPAEKPAKRPVTPAEEEDEEPAPRKARPRRPRPAKSGGLSPVVIGLGAVLLVILAGGGVYLAIRPGTNKDEQKFVSKSPKLPPVDNEPGKNDKKNKDQTNTDQGKKPAQGNIFEVVSAAVKKGDIEETALMGLGDKTYREVPANGELLVGLEVGIGKFGSQEVIHGIRPIFRSEKGEKKGNLSGKGPVRFVTLLAKEGEAIGAVTIRGGLGLDALQVTFMEIAGTKLDPEKSRKSQWLGGRGGDRTVTLGGSGRPVVGIHGKISSKENAVASLGLISLLR